uniref:NR LBD domain-containing protein n=1 Tax=Ciona savignyi TaxID=51511 RepID=H2YJM5_CIOSA
QGFFRRTIRLKLEYETCMEACTVSIKSRNKCQFCRFKKCIGLGMSRDAIRFGRMPRHEKQQIIREIDESFAQATGSDKCQIKMQNLITEVSESFLRHISLTAERVNKCWESRKTLALTPDHKARLLFASQILKKRTQKGSGPSSKPLKIVQILYCDFQARVVKGICELTEFAKSLPNFLRISLHDQVILLKYGSYETMFVLFSRLIIEDGMLLPKSNIYVTFNFVYQVSKMVGEIMRSKFEFAKRMLSLGLTDVEMALFVGVILLCPDRPGIDNRKVVEDIQEEILLALEYQLSLTHPNKPRLFAHLLLKLAELRELMSKHVSMVQKLSEMKGIGPPLLNEILQDLT